LDVRYNNEVPKVTILPEGKTVEFEKGKMPYSEHGKPESLLDICLNNGIHLEHACGGNNACTTCHVIVKAGGDNQLSEMDDDEADRLEMAPGLTLHSRLGCQCVVQGDITVEIPSWNRNYVSEGGGSMNLGNAIPPPKKPGELKSEPTTA
jgi:2Fe-2S ferredoxin